jgi:hypothetical protein
MVMKRHEGKVGDTIRPSSKFGISLSFNLRFDPSGEDPAIVRWGNVLKMALQFAQKYYMSIMYEQL